MNTRNIYLFPVRLFQSQSVNQASSYYLSTVLLIPLSAISLLPSPHLCSPHLSTLFQVFLCVFFPPPRSTPSSQVLFSLEFFSRNLGSNYLSLAFSSSLINLILQYDKYFSRFTFIYVLLYSKCYITKRDHKEFSFTLFSQELNLKCL